MLLKCPSCGTHYEVDDELFSDPSVQVQCESCDIVLTPVQKEPKVQDEKTAMLAAFDPDELEKYIAQPKAAPAAARSAAKRVPAAAPPTANPPPTASMEPFRPGRPAPADTGERPAVRGGAANPAAASAQAKTTASPMVPPSVGARPEGMRVGAGGPRETIPAAPRRGKSGPGAGIRSQEDPFAAGAGAGLAESAESQDELEDLGATCRPFGGRTTPPERPAPARSSRAAAAAPATHAPPAPNEPSAEPPRSVEPQPSIPAAGERGRAEPASRRPSRAAEAEPPRPPRRDPEEEEDEEEEEESERQPPEPVRVTPKALLILVPILLIVFLAVSGYLLWGLFHQDSEAQPVGPTKTLSWSASVGLLMQRNQGTYASTKFSQEIKDALPLFVHEDGIRIRGTNAVELEGGRVPKTERMGYLIKNLAVRLAQEIAPYKPPKAPPAEEGQPAAAPPPPPLGKGAKAIMIMAESSLAFDTIGRILFTAQSVGYRTIYLAGQAADAPDTVKGYKLESEKLTWFRIGAGKGGRGLGLAVTPEGYSIFDRQGEELPIPAEEPTEDKNAKKDRVEVPRGGNALQEVTNHLKELSGTGKFKVFTVQPAAATTYEQLLVLLETVLGAETDSPFFADTILSGGDI